MPPDEIRIHNARSHNLRGVSCRIPIARLSVVTGVSGSGKSTLAFDTLYAEGQRRYVTSLSAYARQFLERLPRPEVDFISNVPPAIAIAQRNPVTNARSTVGTATEILDHLRLLYAKIGETRCCGQTVAPGGVEAVTERILERFQGLRVTLAARIPRSSGERPAELRARMAREGYTRLLLEDGSLLDLTEISPTRLSRERGRALSVIDRLALAGGETRGRLSEAVSVAFARGEHRVVVVDEAGERATYREGLACDRCGRIQPTPEPALFSFNSVLGACEACQGFGRTAALDLDRVVPDPDRTLREGAIAPFATPGGRGCQRDLMRACKRLGIPTDRSWKRLGKRSRALVVEGDGDAWYGVRGFFEWLEGRRYKVQARVQIARYRRFDPCEACGGTRLRPEALEVLVGGHHIGEVARMTLGALDAWLGSLELSPAAKARGGRIQESLAARVRTANRVGLSYLSLERQVRTLSGGEAQRIQLATALGGVLTAALYVLDEPSVGLHPRDVSRLLEVLYAIRDQGNTVVVVEHAPEIVAAADHLIDLGPGPGRRGGTVVAEGTVAEICREPASITGRALAGELRPRRRRRRASGRSLRIIGARCNNLRDLSLEVPLQQLVVVTGVSGAGKSSLVRSVLVGQLRRDPDRGECDRIEGAEQIREVVLVDPTPPSRSLRSNPATVSKAFDGIRRKFAGSAEARRRGLAPGWFSFNVAGGRCEKCEGIGERVVDMQFLEDLRVPCESCGGSRYRQEARGIRLQGRSIVDVLALTIEEALALFSEDRGIAGRLLPLARVGLGYLTLAQPLVTLSGGELQRLRLAQALAVGKPDSLYVLDEPTTGLHPAEIGVLLACLDELLEAGGSVVVVEHNLELIAESDHVIDLGPEGGPGGGLVVARGTPRQVARVRRSHTGAALRARRREVLA
jgi:excinuclease ABC subunit A